VEPSSKEQSGSERSPASCAACWSRGCPWKQLPAGVSEEPLLDEPWKLVVPAGTLLGADHVDLSRLSLPWLGVEASAASAAVVDRLRAASGGGVEPVHRYQEISTALALVAAGEGVAVVPVMALNGLVLDGVDVVDVPGLGARRIVLRRFDRGRSLTTPVDTIARLLHESVAAFDRDGPVAG
jgi:DNA-binding transcriptional LysR family regulator